MFVTGNALNTVYSNTHRVTKPASNLAEMPVSDLNGLV